MLSYYHHFCLVKVEVLKSDKNRFTEAVAWQLTYMSIIAKRGTTAPIRKTSSSTVIVLF